MSESVEVSIVMKSAIDRVIMKNLFLKIFILFTHFSILFWVLLNVFNSVSHSLWKTFFGCWKPCKKLFDNYLFSCDQLIFSCFFSLWKSLGEILFFMNCQQGKIWFSTWFGREEQASPLRFQINVPSSGGCWFKNTFHTRWKVSLPTLFSKCFYTNSVQHPIEWRTLILICNSHEFESFFAYFLFNVNCFEIRSASHRAVDFD